jgi:hypothetical protein
LHEDEKLAIDTARDRVRNALKEKDAQRLKRAVQELDRATESLAAQIVEHVMDHATGA